MRSSAQTCNSSEASSMRCSEVLRARALAAREAALSRPTRLPALLVEPVELVGLGARSRTIPRKLVVRRPRRQRAGSLRAPAMRPRT